MADEMALSGGGTELAVEVPVLNHFHPEVFPDAVGAGLEVHRVTGFSR